MASLVTHLVIGERVFAQLPQLAAADYAPFLLGCLLVDVNNLPGIDRRRTHFAGTLTEDGPAAFTTMCTGFLRGRDELLLRPWNELDGTGQAFVAGYLCHLAADEEWKRLAWSTLSSLGIKSVAELPVPGGVLMTAFSVMSNKTFINHPAIVTALSAATIPDVLTHVPHAAFQAMWNLVQDHVLDGHAPESFFELLLREGRSNAEVQAIRERHARYWDEALALIRDMGGVELYVQRAVRHSLEVMPRLWTEHSPPGEHQ